jgi:hypothetical protein
MTNSSGNFTRIQQVFDSKSTNKKQSKLCETEPHVSKNWQFGQANSLCDMMKKPDKKKTMPKMPQKK